MYRDLKELLSAFNAHGVKYLVVGDSAVWLQTQPRSTKDVNVFVKAGADNAAAVLEALSSFGAPLTGIAIDDLANPGKVVRFVGKESIVLDVPPGVDGIGFDAAWEKRVEVIIDRQSGLTAYFISADDLISAQIAAGNAARPRGH